MARKRTQTLEPVWSEGIILPDRPIDIVADIIQSDSDEESTDREGQEEIDQDELSDAYLMIKKCRGRKIRAQIRGFLPFGARLGAPANADNQALSFTSLDECTGQLPPQIESLSVGVCDF